MNRKRFGASQVSEIRIKEVEDAPVPSNEDAAPVPSSGDDDENKEAEGETKNPGATRKEDFIKSLSARPPNKHAVVCKV